MAGFIEDRLRGRTDWNKALGRQFLRTSKLSSTLGRQLKGGNISILPCLEKMGKYSSTDHISPTM